MLRRSRSSLGRNRNRITGGPVGTEAVALANIKKNAKNFRYPPEGFVTPIEHSLLYAMISEPKLFPQEAIQSAIKEEDFLQYLPIATKTTPSTAALQQQNEGQPEVGQENELGQEERVSYKQLSALLALAAEKWPPPTSRDEGDVNGVVEGGGESNQRQSSTTSGKNNDNKDDDNSSISKILCKALLQCVVRHSEAHDLDREAEVKELLAPLEYNVAKKDLKNFLTTGVPAYLMLTASMLTANPLPLLIGSTVTSVIGVGVDAKQIDERRNLGSVASETYRVADVEKTSLLDESEDL